MTLQPSLTLIILTVSFSYAYAQSGHYQLSPASAGMGYANTTLSDAWVMYNNIGGLGTEQSFNIAFAVENLYQEAGLNRVGATIILPAAWGNLGGSFFRFGDELYSEQLISLGYGNRLGLASLGVRVNYLQHQVEGIGTKGSFLIDFGGIAEISEQLYFGAYINNLTQSELDELEPLPTLLRAGVSYRPLPHLMLNFELEKDLDYAPTTKWGIAYTFLEKFTLRTGVNTNPVISYFGLGFKAKRLAIDYAFSHHHPLGFSHQIGATVKISSSE